MLLLRGENNDRKGIFRGKQACDDESSWQNSKKMHSDVECSQRIDGWRIRHTFGT